MPAVSNVLVAGAGLAGTATAIALATTGVAVDLIEIKPEITAVGSGITMQGNGLRELRRLGVWDDVLAARVPVQQPGAARARPGRHAARRDARRADRRSATCPPRSACPAPRSRGSWRTARWRPEPNSGSAPRVSSLSQDDGRRGRRRSPTARPAATTWSSAADGIRSATRRMIGIADEPRPTGMGIFRAFGPRPASVTRTDLYYGGPCYIAGYCPTGENTLYAYVVEDAQDRSALTPAERLAVMRALAGAYHGPWDDILQTLTDPANDQLHPVRGAGRSRAVEPGAGRADRRRRARLPADPGPGWRAGPGGRGRAVRTAAFL